MKPVCIVDLDGTVADLSHRLHYIKHPHGQRDYDSFFANVDKDIPYNNIIDLVDLYLRDGDYNIVFVSGRSDVCREETIAWINREFCLITEDMPQNKIPDMSKLVLDNSLESSSKHVSYSLYMRKQGDHRSDYAVKKEILQQIREDGYNPVLAIDDRDSICKLWVEEGITCLKHMNSHVNEEYLHENLGKLYIMVGPSGAGKTQWLRDNTLQMEETSSQYSPLYLRQVVSSDDLRYELCNGDFKDQSKNEQVFKAAHALIHTRITNGLDTWFDATNIRDKDRRAVVECVPSNTDITYIVIDRPLEEKIRDGGWRNDIIMKDGNSLVEKHHNTFKSNLTNILKGDNYSNVKVIFS